MPLSSLLPAIVSSIVGSIIDEVANIPPAVPTMGIVRNLPAETKLGEMEPPVQGQVRINGETFSLSPVAVIRNELNMMVLPSMVFGPVKVRYQTDFTGSVHRVWILSTAEAELADNR